ncbi:Bax inhibitor-1/YccA family protein [Bauldia sp.]|uniref:Bax inhibitor-1/YccA family protein n=1 Tax=Bauldia sp. TaxID=2575872 RepID=UPI003BA9AE38
MANYDNQQARYGARAGAVPAIDEGLRAHMLRVYNYMAAGLAITGVSALVTAMLAISSTPTEFTLPNGVSLTTFGAALFGSPLQWVVILAPLAMVFFLSFRIQKMSVSGAQTTFWVFALLMGISMSSIFLIYTSTSITQVFFISAAMFGAMSIWGYTTKRDLTKMGSFLFMGVIGLLVAMIVNIFLGSNALGFAISVIGVGIFVGLTAYDTQKIKEMYDVNDDGSVAGRKAVMGALMLYFDLILIFQFMLSLFGNRQ